MRVIAIILCVLIGFLGGCASVEGLRDKSATIAIQRTGGLESIAVLPIRENLDVAGLSSLVETYMPMMFHEGLRGVAVVDPNTVTSRMIKDDKLNMYAGWRSAYETTSVMQPNIVRDLGGSVGVKHFLFVHGVSISRERIRAVDTGYSGWVKNSYHVWRTNLKITAELINIKDGRQVWKGVGWAENIDSVRRDINLGLIIAHPETVPEISHAIKPMVQTAIHGIITQIKYIQ